MSGALLMAAAGGGFYVERTVTAGTSGANVGFESGVYGSLDLETMSDASGVSRGIALLITTSDTTFTLGLSAPVVPNTSAVFSGLIVFEEGGVKNIFLRTNATYDDDVGGVYSSWTWTTPDIDWNNAGEYLISFF